MTNDSSFKLEVWTPSFPSSRLGTHFREALLLTHAKQSFGDAGSQAGAWEPELGTTK